MSDTKEGLPGFVQPKIKRILIIDDDTGAFPNEHMFDTIPVGDGKPPLKGELVVAKDIHDATAQLDAWAKEGHQADLVSIDLHEGRDLKEVGEEHWHAINDWSRKNIAFQPISVFFHSAGNLHPYEMKSVSEADRQNVFYKQEITEAISQFNADQYPLEAFKNAPELHLIPHLNESWGTKYPANEAELHQARVASGAVEVKDAPGMVERKELTRRLAVRKIMSDSIKIYPELDASGYAGSREAFARHSGADVKGYLAFNGAQVEALHKLKFPVILAQKDYDPDTITLLPKLKGIVLLGIGTQHNLGVYTARGVAALSYNKSLHIENAGTDKAVLQSADGAFKAGYAEPVSLCGKKLYPAELPDKAARLGDAERTVAGWADDICEKEKGLRVYANVDRGEEVKDAIKYGATGVGLVRTEHFLHHDAETRRSFRELLETDPHDPQNADALEEHYDTFYNAQRKELVEIFKAARKGGEHFPVTVRLLDAPPGEFFEGSADEVKADLAWLEKRLGGRNNMRGSRLALQYKGLYQKQSEAIFDAAAEAGFKGDLKIMLPLVYNADEVKALKQEVVQAASGTGEEIKYQFGAMIETRDAVKNAGTIAQHCDFFSIGGNDLTEEVVGCARNDFDKTFEWMRQQNNLVDNPFLTLVPKVVKEIETAVRLARREKPNMPIGICSDQVKGDYSSILKCQELGLDSISMMPEEGALVKSRILAGKARLEVRKHIEAVDDDFAPIYQTIKREERNRARDRFVDVLIGTGWAMTNIGKTCMEYIDKELVKCNSVHSMEQLCKRLPPKPPEPEAFGRNDPDPPSGAKQTLMEHLSKDDHDNPFLDYLLETYCNFVRMAMKIEVVDPEKTPWITRVKPRDPAAARVVD